MRKEEFAKGEHYHIYNRGVDKRSIFLGPGDSLRFLTTLTAFNTTEPTGGLYEISLKKIENKNPEHPLINIVAYCLNPNHFHLLLEQVADNGISKFIQRVAGGYTWYFNQKQNRSGALFQGRFKAKHIKDNDHFLRVSAYINANDRIHQIGGESSALVRSSLREFVGPSLRTGICKKDIVLGQFNSPAEYQNYIEELIPEMIEAKTLEHVQELAELWHES